METNTDTSTATGPAPLPSLLAKARALHARKLRAALRETDAVRLTLALRRLGALAELVEALEAAARGETEEGE
jgi:hypothetical protein